MKIEILGTGCSKCKKLTQLVQETVNELGVSAEVVKVENINDIMNYGVMITPAMAIDKQIKSAGRIPSKDEIKKWINENEPPHPKGWGILSPFNLKNCSMLFGGFVSFFPFQVQW